MSFPEHLLQQEALCRCNCATLVRVAEHSCSPMGACSTCLYSMLHMQLFSGSCTCWHVQISRLQLVLMPADPYTLELVDKPACALPASQEMHALHTARKLVVVE